MGEVSENSYQSELLSRPDLYPGACPAQGADAHPAYAGVAWHYGDPLGEQSRLHEQPVVVDRSHRAVIEVSGEDAAEFLNTLLSQKLDDVPTGFTSEALDLDAQGRILHAVRVLRTSDGFLLDIPRMSAESFQGFLERMVFWSKVTVTASDLRLFSVLGSSPTELPALLPEDALWRAVTEDSLQRVDVFIPPAHIDAYLSHLSAHGVGLVGLMAWTAERVRTLTPLPEVDLDDKSIPHEVSQWIGRDGKRGAVHLHKGCYRGQETVARVENLGSSPRVLVRLQLDGSAPALPQVGDPITSGSRPRPVGRVGTVVQDYEYGPVALAVLKRSALGSDQLHVGECAVAVDPDSLPRDAHHQAGREAVERFRAGS